MRIDKAGIPFIAGALVPAALLAGSRRFGWATGFTALAAFFAYFFRDPERQVPSEPGLVVSPADGRVVVAGPADPRWSPPGTWTQVTIFLSPMDVHMNRTPVDGGITRIAYRTGTFLPAYKAEAGQNELNEIWIDHHGEPVVVRQIVGVLARRIVCRVAEGQTLARGERIGLMKFGSRMDVFLPPRADLLVRVGQHVVAGETVLARLPVTPSARPGA
jgi:phosphatidylserine decarboxylase